MLPFSFSSYEVAARSLPGWPSGGLKGRIAITDVGSWFMSPNPPLIAIA